VKGIVSTAYLTKQNKIFAGKKFSTCMQLKSAYALDSQQKENRAISLWDD